MVQLVNAEYEQARAKLYDVARQSTLAWRDGFCYGLACGIAASMVFGAIIWLKLT